MSKLEKGEEFTTIKKNGLNLQGVKESPFSEKIAKSLSLSKEEQEMLQKGEVTDNFSGYGEKQMRVKKTGKEIKVGLTKKQAELTAKKDVNETKAKTLLSEIAALGCKAEPNQIPWQCKDMGDTAPKLFGWDIRDAYEIPYNIRQKMKKKEVDGTADTDCVKQEEGLVMQDSAGVSELTNEERIKWMKVSKIKNKMNEYNEIIETNVQVVKDLDMVNTLMNNLEDKSSYELTMGQLKAAGL